MCEAPFHTQARTPPPPSPAEPSEHPWVKVPSNGPRGRNNAVSEAQARNVNGPGEWRPHVRAWRGCGLAGHRTVSAAPHTVGGTAAGGPQALLPVLAQLAVPCSLLPRNPARAMSRNETQPAPREAVSGEARGRCEVPSPPGRRGNSRGRCGSQEPAPHLHPLAEWNVCRSSCPISVGLPRPVAPVPLSQASAAAQTRTRSRMAPPTCGARPASAFPCCEALCQMPHEHTRA